MNIHELRRIFPRKFWLGVDEVPWLYGKAGQAEGLIVEIGAAYGGSATVFLMGKPPGLGVVSVDAFVEDPHTHFRASACECQEAVRQAVGGALYQDWALMAMRSDEAAVGWSTPIGLLYVDGDHEYEGVRRDVELWAPHVEADGAIILHDSRRLPDANPCVFARGWQGPTRLVEELVQGGAYSVIDTCYSMTELRRA